MLFFLSFYPVRENLRGLRENLKHKILSQVGGQSAEEARIASPQSSTTDSAIGGSTSPDETSQRQNNLADSSFSDEREENFESYGENGDVEYEA